MRKQQFIAIRENDNPHRLYYFGPFSNDQEIADWLTSHGFVRNPESTDSKTWFLPEYQGAAIFFDDNLTRHPGQPLWAAVEEMESPTANIRFEWINN